MVGPATDHPIHSYPMKFNSLSTLFKQPDRFLLVALITLITGLSAAGAPYTWDASGGGALDDGAGNWNATGGTNWFDGTSFGAWGNTTSDAATFGVASGTAGTINVGTVNANAITFAPTGSGNYSLSGGTITLGGTTPTITTTANATISSTITGSAGLKKAGAGILTLSGNNTHSGTTTWNASGGELLLASDGALGSSTVSLGNGTLSSTGGSGGTRVISNAFNLNGTPLTLGTTTNNDRLIFTSNLTVPSSPSWFVNSNVILTGTISGSGLIRPSVGAGILSLTGNNSGFTGGARLDGSTLLVGHTNALGSSGLILFNGGAFKYGSGVTNDYSSRFNNASSISYQIDTSENNVTFGTAITPTGTPTAPLYKFGTGTLTLNSSSASTFTGGLFLNGGTLLEDFSTMSSNLVSASNGPRLYGGTLSIKGNSTGATAQTLGGPLFFGDPLDSNRASASGITINNNGGSGTTLTLGSTFTRYAGNTLNIDISNGGTINTGIAAGTQPFMTVNDSGGIGFGRTDGTKIVRLTGQTTLAANSNNSGSDFITSGALAMNSGSKSANTITLDGASPGGALDIGTGTLSSNGFLLMGNNNYTISNGTTGGSEVIVHTMGTGTLTVSATATGATAFTKSGPGTLLLSGARSHSGITRLVQGTLAVDNNASLGTGLLYIGGDTTLRTDANVSLSNNITLDGRGMSAGNVRTNRYLTVNTNGNDATLSGAIGSGGGLVKTGAGTLTLSGTNTYTGGTTIAGGTLAISSNSNLGDSKYTPLSVSGGTLRVTGTSLTHINTRSVNWDSFNGGLDIAHANNTFTVANNISGPGALTKSGAGTLVLTGTNTHTGSTTVSAGTLLISTGSMNSTSQINLTGGVFNYGSSTGLSRNVTVNGGNFKYNSNSAYTGTLTLTSGVVSGSGNLGSTPLNIGSGVTLAPGNSPGTTSSGSQTWGSLGSYQCEINKVASSGGVQGNVNGWDWDNITGNLNITATSGSKFTIDIVGLDSSTNLMGTVAGFDNTQDYTWTIASVTGSVSGFDPSVFTLSTGNFTNNNSIGTGSFSIEQLGSDINLKFTAVPEPSPASFVILGVLSIPMMRRFRRQ